jgi:multidrug transporter EmrE-like cation transporter
MSELTQFGSAALHVISTVAPTVATALGGPFAGTAVAALERALGVQGKDNVEQAVLLGNPEALAKVQEAEIDLKKTLASLKIQEEQLQYSDIANARAREAAVRDYTPSVLAWLVTVGFFGLIVAMLRIDVPKDNQAIVYALVGTLGAVWTSIAGYYYGSSASSRTKTDGLVAAIANKK